MVLGRLQFISGAGITLRNSFAQVVPQAHVLLCCFDFDVNIKKLLVLNERLRRKFNVHSAKLQVPLLPRENHTLSLCTAQMVSLQAHLGFFPKETVSLNLSSCMH